MPVEEDVQRLRGGGGGGGAQEDGVEFYLGGEAGGVLVWCGFWGGRCRERVV